MSDTSLKLSFRDAHVKEAISDLVALLVVEECEDNLKMLLLLLSPSAMVHALLAGLFPRAQLADCALIFVTLFDDFGIDFGIEFNNFAVLL